MLSDINTINIKDVEKTLIKAIKGGYNAHIVINGEIHLISLNDDENIKEVV